MASYRRKNLRLQCTLLTSATRRSNHHLRRSRRICCLHRNAHHCDLRGVGWWVHCDAVIQRVYNSDLMLLYVENRELTRRRFDVYACESATVTYYRSSVSTFEVYETWLHHHSHLLKTARTEGVILSLLQGPLIDATLSLIPRPTTVNENAHHPATVTNQPTTTTTTTAKATAAAAAAAVQQQNIVTLDLGAESYC